VARRLRRLWAAASCLAVAVCWAAAAAGATPVGQVERFDVGCSPRALLAGPDSTLWFTCFDGDVVSGGRARVGLISQTGKVITYGRGIDRNSEPAALALGPDGNLWFAINTGSSILTKKHPAAIGRMTPGGQIATFRAGLSPKAVLGNIVAGPDGNLWFNEGGPAPAIGRITPTGEITEFRAGLLEKSAPGGLAVGAEGNLWFSDPAATVGRISPSGEIAEFGPPQSGPGFNGGAPAVAADGSVWLSGGDERPAIVRVSPSGSISEFAAGLFPRPTTILSPLAGADGAFWFTVRGQLSGSGGAGAKLGIGRVGPDGAIAEYDHCLHSGPPFTGPETIVAGPEGNLWFTSVTTRSLPNIGTPPAIGRVTPSGEITEFRAGVRGDPKFIAAAPNGQIWFAGNSGETIERISPSDQPPNTFLVERPKRAAANGVTQVPVTVPGPGSLQLEQRALLLPRGRQVALDHTTATVRADSCGAALLPVAARGNALEKFRATDLARIKFHLTFTPDGGTPNGRSVSVSIYR